MRRPTLQDLRRLKFTRQIVQRRASQPTNLQVFRDHTTKEVQASQLTMSTFREESLRSESVLAPPSSSLSLLLLLSSSLLLELPSSFSTVSSSSSSEDDSGISAS
jgi:hypothetical protein